MTLRKTLFLLIIMAMLPQLSSAQLKTKYVTIFKNGTAFIQKSGEVKTKESSFVWTENLPEAIYGTFWFSSPTGTIVSVKSKADTIVKQREWVSFLDLIQSNVGKEADIVMEEDKKVSGKIVNAKGNGLDAIVLLETTTGYLIIKSFDITQVSIKGDLNQMVESKNVQTAISINFQKPKDKQTLESTYLSKGFNWTPMYQLNLNDETSGTLSLKASIKNNAEKIENAQVNLVVGSPNFLTTTQLSDLISFQFNVFNNFKNTNGLAFANNAAGRFYEMDAKGNDNGNVNITASGLADLYLFKLDNFSMDKGERGFFPLFETKVKVEHKYVCNLAGNAVVNNNNYLKKYASFSDVSQFYHQLKIWNNSANPFTSGTLIINKDLNGVKQALATAKLDYTAIENCSYATISNAPDLEIKEEEIETSRTSASKYWNKNKYVAINVSSTITVHNYKSKKAHLEIKRMIYGELKKSDLPWKITAIANHYYVNEGSNVTWSMDVEPGNEKTITYSYVVYVRG
ncbi:MAG: hypothetical protein ACI9JN_000059 [Bacteroidia bacterium]|jgi:hypothetical protein